MNINWGIIGCGDVTEVKSGPAFNLINNSQLVAVMRRNAVKAEDYAKRHNVPKWYSNADDLINDPDVNAIYIATPPNVHAELTIKALEVGKAVYVEKPMALNYAQCQQMVAASKKYNTPLFVAYYRRALPGFIKVKELITVGAIGEVKFMNMQLYKLLTKEYEQGNQPWRVNPEIAGGGHFFDLAAHQIDFVDFLFGPIQKVQGLALNQSQIDQVEDIVSASFVVPGNIVVNGSWCFTIPKFLERDVIEIIGDKGKITFSCFDFLPVELSTNKGVEVFEYAKPKHVQLDMIELVVNDLLGKAKAPSIGETGARTSWVLDEVVKNYYNKI